MVGPPVLITFLVICTAQQVIKIGLVKIYEDVTQTGSPGYYKIIFPFDLTISIIFFKKNNFLVV